jgi:hypothetical protein
MASVPTTERPPKNLNAYWLGVWRRALKTMKAQDTWAPEQKPLLDEYVYALRGAEAAREGFTWLEKLEDVDELTDTAWKTLASIAGGLPTQWDRHTKRAAALAEALILTPKSQRAHGIGTDEEDEEDDGFGALDAADELAPRRTALRSA